MKTLPYQGVTRRRRQRGIALFVGLLFLVMLTLVALLVMRGTMLEMHLVNASARHEQAFEASEATRAIPEAVLADHVFNRGWPKGWGGDVPDSMFDLNSTFANRTGWVNLLNPKTAASGKGLQNDCTGNNLVSFYMPITCTSHSASYNYDVSAWDSAMLLSVCSGGSSASSCSSSQQIDSTINVVRDGVMPNSGSGGAQAQGYASPGIGMATGGAALMLQIRSDAKVAGNGEAATIAQYKQVITH